ncbi:MAG TPA: polyketide synthase dehydratase domain-containing protein, partial [Clostridia bacterium]|nr:polyketide synthase dehydratase domain-containing protein [Clostridia bacterium]
VEANGEIKEYPRRAGISSCGAGGANARLVVEESIPDTGAEIPADNNLSKVIIVLSAKSEGQLKARAQQLRNLIREKQYYGLNLAEMAYTLQVGREAMDERLAVIADSFEKLEEKLNGFISGSDDIEDLYHGQVKRNKESLVAFAEDEDLKNAIDMWIMKEKYAKLMELWIKGYNMDWNKLYGEVKPQRISLPTYPFEEECFWVPFADKKPTSNIYDLTTSASIHPLLHRNISDFMEQRFCSTFTGEEFFLKDHVVEGQRVLPGVAYLEMAREALELATGTYNNENKLVCLSNVVWLRPFAVGYQAEQLCIGLHPGDNGQISYEFYNRSNEGDTDRKVYSQGMAALSSCMEYPSWDIGELKAHCSRDTISFGRYYDIYRAGGIDYGPGYRGVDEVYIGEDRLLARLSLPASISDTKDMFVLHPSLLDSGAHAYIAMMADFSGAYKDSAQVSNGPVLPFAMEKLEVFKRCSPVMWSYIRHSNGSAVNNKITKLDIDLCDENGNVCVRITGMSGRVLEGKNRAYEKQAPTGTSSNIPVGNIMMAPVWNEFAIENGEAFQADRVVIAGGTEDIRENIRKIYPKAGDLEISTDDTPDTLVYKLKALDKVEHIIWIAP